MTITTRADPLPEEQHDYLTIYEFADVVGVSPRTVWRWVVAGKVKHWRRGSTTRIPRSELEITA